METERFIKPVAYIHTGFKEKFGIPRQSGRVEEALGRIVFAEGYRDSEALREIEGFSHLWLIFSFSELQHDKWTPTVRPPRLGGNKKVGVFASRSPFRPNGLGLSSVRLLGVETTEKEGTVLVVSGADLLDGTPIYDIKPYIVFSDCHTDAVSGYAEDNRNYHLEVNFPKHLENIIPEEFKEIILKCIAEDPRPSYQDEPDRIYGMRYDEYDVKFTVSNGVANIVSVDVIQT